jgi:hypothetical protein
MNDPTFIFHLTHSLEKIFPDKPCRSPPMDEPLKLSVLTGEIPSFQLVYYGEKKARFKIEIKNAPCAARLRQVELVHSDFPCYTARDENYLRTTPGMFPDLLTPMSDNVITVIPEQYRACWIDFSQTKAASPGNYPVEILIKHVETDENFCTLRLDLKIVGAVPGGQPIHTEWFHADCLADYYHAKVWSEKHWTVLKNFIACAASEHKVNMLMTPVLPPSLDTAEGHYRTGVQLAEIFFEDGQYTFNFKRLKRWCEICKRHGVEYIEMPPFFTQWGAVATPGIVVSTATGSQRKFGWDVPAASPEYRQFLEAFIPAVIRELESNGYDKAHIYFHVSDEPSIENMDQYMAARSVFLDLIEGCPSFDALSSYAFYEKGLVNEPVVANDHIQPFIDNNVQNLWMYYCCGQSVDVPNRFFAMPSARNRIIGVLMYLYDIKGFLHWGYNFYNSQLSRRHINPFLVTHADYAFPSGDAFLVYPGENNRPYSSIRGEVLRSAFDDYGALKRLEVLIGRERTKAVIYEGIPHTMTFKDYPKDAVYFLKLRERVNNEIEKNLFLF